MADLTLTQVVDKFSENKADVDLTKKVGCLTLNEETVVSLPFSTFEASSLPQEYIKKLYETGFKEPTPIQARSWPIAIQGKDIIAVAKTGSGRKLGFLIPAFIYVERLQNNPRRGPTVLVLCPTDDITAQVHSELVKFGVPAGIKTACLHGEEELDIAANVVVATLERLIEILENGKLNLEQVTYLVLYEFSDHLLSASVDSLIHKIVCQIPSKHRQTLVFTTTWSTEAKHIASLFLHDPVMISVEESYQSELCQVVPAHLVQSVSKTDGIAVTDSYIELQGLSGASYSSVPKELGAPAQKKLLILDVNGVLAYFGPLYSTYANPAQVTISGKPVFKRPFCTDFLKFCFANFEVGIWSSRNKKNLALAVDYLLGDLKNNLIFCWDQSKCTTTNLKAKDNPNKPIFFKELKKVWEEYEPGLPWPKGRFTKANTLLVDDSPYKGLCNPPFTTIFPNPYNFQNKEDKSLGVEGDLRLYLEKAATAEDVQCYVKDNPFGQPAMTESHPDWNYYLPAMAAFSNT